MHIIISYTWMDLPTTNKNLGGLRTPGCYACLYHNFCFSEPVINK